MQVWTDFASTASEKKALLRFLSKQENCHLPPLNAHHHHTHYVHDQLVHSNIQKSEEQYKYICYLPWNASKWLFKTRFGALHGKISPPPQPPPPNCVLTDIVSHNIIFSIVPTLLKLVWLLVTAHQHT